VFDKWFEFMNKAKKTANWRF